MRINNGIILNSDTVMKTYTSHSKSPNNITESPIQLEDNLKEHYSNFCHTLHQIKYDKHENFTSLCIMNKSIRLAKIKEVFPLATEEGRNGISLILTESTKRFDCIQFKPIENYGTISTYIKNPAYSEERLAMGAKAKLLKDVKIRDHEVWPNLMSKYISCFRKVDLNFVGIMLTACYANLDEVVAFCNQYYMLKTMGFKDTIHMVYLLCEPGNMREVLLGIKDSIVSYSVPQSFFSAPMDYVKQHSTFYVNAMAKFFVTKGVKTFCLTVGGTVLCYFLGKPTYDLLTIGRPRPLIELKEEAEPHPYKFSGSTKESKIAKIVANGIISGIGSFFYYVTTAAMEPGVAASTAQVEALTKIVTKTGTNLGSTFQIIKESFKEGKSND